MVRAIIDTDPGIDDAVAILLALSMPGWAVLGLTTVAGNIGLERTTRNAGRILALAGRPDIPVIEGADRPLARAPIDAGWVHGGDGLGGVAFPEPLAAPRSGAVAWMAGTLAAEPPGTVDILALGPMTNLALLLRDHPGAAGRARRIIAMGGAVAEPGNVGPRGEFNLAADPEAAAAVLAGLPVTLIPLDVTRKVRAGPAELAALRGSDRPHARASADLIAAYFQTTRGGESRPLHDPCVMLMAAEPGLFAVETRGLAVALDADPGALDPGGPPVAVAMGVDAPAALALLTGRLAGGPAG
jgi:purine nucleosidase